MDKIRHIPGYIVQGRYDMVCPMYTAWELHEAWPEAQFELMPTAGHSCMGKNAGAGMSVLARAHTNPRFDSRAEPTISDGLIRATDRFGAAATAATSADAAATSAGAASK